MHSQSLQLLLAQRVCLIVIDGWGVSCPAAGDGDNDDANTAGELELDAIKAANPAHMTALQHTAQYTTLTAHGTAVGLPSGLMGNSEVGHLNIGAGRPVYQDTVRITKGIADRSLLFRLKDLLPSPSSTHLHLVGLVSDGGVHSSLQHLLAICAFLKECNICFSVHAITDGRDTAPRSAVQYLAQVPNVATVVGRYYAMDRDKRWERIQLALDALLLHNHPSDSVQYSSFDELQSLITAKYTHGETDEFFKPMIASEPRRIRPDTDAVLFFNFRSDRMRQLVSKFREHFPSPSQQLICMTRYSEEFTDLPVLSPPQHLGNVLSECIASHGLAQCHIAETEKYAHVTFFFNGGREPPFPLEQRILIPSPKVATYDLKPEMSVAEVADAVCTAVAQQKVAGGTAEFAFILANLAPPDMVGHTGNYAATLQAIRATDDAIGRISRACATHNVALVITADHGNAEKMTHNGQPHTAHTCAPVPLIVANAGSCNSTADVLKCKSLCDVAPLVLSLMGLPVPPEMTGSASEPETKL